MLRACVELRNDAGTSSDHIGQDVTLTPLHINTLLYNLLVGLKYLHSAAVSALSPIICTSEKIAWGKMLPG